MRLLLDEMYAPAAARALRERGHQVIAVKEHDELRGLEDGDLLAAATLDRRSVVTENVADFARLHGQLSAAGKQHAGIVFVHQRRYPRTRTGRRRLVDALDELLAGPPELGPSWVWWLA